jgi:hypothetical protein
MTYRSEIDEAITEFEESVKTCVHLVYASDFYEESTRHWSKERDRRRERLRKMLGAQHDHANIVSATYSDGTRARFCTDCGTKLPERATAETGERAR